MLTDSDRTRLYQVPSGRVVRTWPVGRIARLTGDARMFVRVDKEFGAISLGDPATRTVAGTLDVKTADNGADNGSSHRLTSQSSGERNQAMVLARFAGRRTLSVMSLCQHVSGVSMSVMSVNDRSEARLR